MTARQDRNPPTLAQLATDHENGADLVHADLGVTPSSCPFCNEEPHHAAGRRRTAAEQAALGGAARAHGEAVPPGTTA